MVPRGRLMLCGRFAIGVVGLICAALMIGVVGCGDDGDVPGATEPSSRKTDLSGDQLQAVRAVCPPRLTGAAKSSTCGLVFVAAESERCPVGSGGSDLTVSGMSCKVGRALSGAFSGVLSDYESRHDVVYQPALATGRWPDLRPSADTGWTCRADYDGDVVRHTCWRESESFSFDFG